MLIEAKQVVQLMLGRPIIVINKDTDSLLLI